MTIRHHRGDLPNLDHYKNIIAVDTETLGLNLQRDRLCVVQLSPGDGSADVVQIEKGQTEAPNIAKLLEDQERQILFHFARFDVAVLKKRLGISVNNIYCTKIASKLVRTYTDRHGLKELVREFLSVELSKQQQSSDWAAETLSQQQLDYAASDVFYLHKLKDALDMRLEREQRLALAKSCFDFLPVRTELDLMGWPETDIFAHS